MPYHVLLSVNRGNMFVSDSTFFLSPGCRPQRHHRKVGFFNMALTAAVLSGLNPLVVVAVALAWKLWASSKFLPRSCRFNPEVRRKERRRRRAELQRTPAKAGLRVVGGGESRVLHSAAVLVGPAAAAAAAVIASWRIIASGRNDAAATSVLSIHIAVQHRRFVASGIRPFQSSQIPLHPSHRGCPFLAGFLSIMHAECALIAPPLPPLPPVLRHGLLILSSRLSSF